MAIIPTGSGNGLARHLKIPLNTKKAVELINRGNFKTIDSIKINDDYFFCTAGFGLDAYVSWKFARAQKRGFWSYVKITLQSVLNYKPKDYKIIVDKKEDQFNNAVLATFANANQYGNNFIISPNSVINDGYVRLIFVQKFPLIYTPVFAYFLLTKQLPKFKFTKEFIGKKITLINKKKKIHIDGEPIKMAKKINVKVIPASLKIIAP